MCVCVRARVCVCVRARGQTCMHEHIPFFPQKRTMQGTQLTFLASFLTNTSYRPLIHLRQSDRSLNEIQQKHFPFYRVTNIFHTCAFSSRSMITSNAILKSFFNCKNCTPIDAQTQNEWRKRKEKRNGYNSRCYGIYRHCCHTAH